MNRTSIPLWLKLAYTLWLVTWVIVYYSNFGPTHFLWICDLANLVLGVAIWLESPLLFSSQAVSVLLIQLVWMIDVASRLLLGFHPIGGTDYMFNASTPLALRSLSLFHVFVPALLMWAIWKLGYDRRGWKLQTALLWLVIPASYALTDPTANVNWMYEPFDLPQTLLPQKLYLAVEMIAIPIVGYLPTHAALTAFARRWGRGLVGNG